MADDVKQNESVDNSSKNPSTSHVEVVGKDSSSSKRNVNDTSLSGMILKTPRQMIPTTTIL